MSPQTPALIIVFVISFVIVPIYDVWAVTNSQPGDTISNVMASLSRYLPILPYWWAILGGHLFATAPPVLDAGGRVAVLVWTSCVIMLLCHAQVLDVSRRWDVVGLLIAGAVVGALLLSQRYSYAIQL